MSLDQCADQYVLALTPRDEIAAVSFRAGDRDSYLRAEAAGLPRRRASTEAALSVRPTVVVTNWGGDPLMMRSLSRRGVNVVRIEEADGFDSVRANVRRVAVAVGQPARGEALVARLNGQLASASGAWRGQSALYLTSAGFTAGRGTLIHSILEGAGLHDQAGPGYGPVSLEQLVLHPPTALVLGFFDRYGLSRQGWAPGRHGVMQAIARTRAIDSVPGALLGCPAWFAGDAVASLGHAAGRR